MTRLTQARIREIQTEVLNWYGEHKRQLPWRDIRDPYRILVSEIMLQQTQVSRVLPKYQAFLAEFPTLESLAAASPAAVIRAWQGLGYNRRALNLQRATRVVRDEHQGIFPSTIEGLRALPGIGRYTAGALATFTFGALEPAVDTNVKQFIDGVVPTKKARREDEYYTIARTLIPADRPIDWLHALMDFVALQPERFPKRRSLKVKGKTEPFIGSTRYLRGRIVDELRIAPNTGERLYVRIAQPIDVTRDRFAIILTKLIADGMIEHKRRHYRLPA